LNIKPRLRRGLGERRYTEQQGCSIHLYVYTEKHILFKCFGDLCKADDLSFKIKIYKTDLYVIKTPTKEKPPIKDHKINSVDAPKPILNTS
jgi:hypothetical protein